MTPLIPGGAPPSLPLPITDAPGDPGIASVCPYCGVGCAVLLTRTDGRLDRVTALGAARHGETPTSLCLKGRQGLDFIHHPDRLGTPLIRREWDRLPASASGPGRWVWQGALPRSAAVSPLGAVSDRLDYGAPHRWAAPFRPATWEEALSLVAQELGRVRRAHGPSAVAALASAKCTNEENYALGRLLRGALGSHNIDHCARLCHAPSVAAMRRQLGLGAATGSVADLDHADVILVAGANCTETHPVIGTRILRAVRGGATLIVVDVRRTELAERATIHLQPTPGTDAALFGAMLRHILARGLEDRDFIAARTRGLDDLRAADPAEHIDAEVEAITGVDMARIREAADLYAHGPATSTLWAMGLTQHRHGTETVTSLVNLALACGMVGRRGAALLPLRGQNNVQGACDMGALPDVYPDQQPVDDPDARARMAAEWGILPEQLPLEPGLRSTAMHADGSPVRALYALGENPALSDPDVGHTERWLGGLEFLVVHDLFLTETARWADVVLPGASFAEKEGTYVNTERRIQLAEPAVASPGLARPELDVLIELTGRLGLPVHARTPEATMAEISRVSPNWAGVSYARLRASGGLQYPVTPEAPDGSGTLHAERFATPDGRAEFVPVPMDRGGLVATLAYPFVVLTGRTRFHWHTGTMTRRAAALADRDPVPVAELHEHDITALDLAPGDRVRVISPSGSIELAWERSDRVRPGQLFIPMHYREAPANQLTGRAVDPVAGTPAFKDTIARVERVRGAAVP